MTKEEPMNNMYISAITTTLDAYKDAVHGDNDDEVVKTLAGVAGAVYDLITAPPPSRRSYRELREQTEAAFAQVNALMDELDAAGEGGDLLVGLASILERHRSRLLPFTVIDALDHAEDEARAILFIARAGSGVLLGTLQASEILEKYSVEEIRDRLIERGLAQPLSDNALMLTTLGMEAALYLNLIEYR
jgi:hypothetical protein